WVKVVQRLPVKIVLEEPPPLDKLLRVGLSVQVAVNVSNLQGPLISGASPQQTFVKSLAASQQFGVTKMNMAKREHTVMTIFGSARRSHYVVSFFFWIMLFSPSSSAVGGAEAARTLSLDEAYRLAVANEEQIQIAGRELAKAQLQPWRAITQLTPQADLTGGYIRNKEELAFALPQGFGGAGQT